METADKDLATLICGGLVVLWNANVRSFEQVPENVPPHDVRLYFLKSPADATQVPGLTMDGEQLVPALAEIVTGVKLFPPAVQARVPILLTKREQLRQQLESLGVEYTRVRDAHKALLKRK